MSTSNGTTCATKQTSNRLNHNRPRICDHSCCGRTTVSYSNFSAHAHNINLHPCLQSDGIRCRYNSDPAVLQQHHLKKRKRDHTSQSHNLRMESNHNITSSSPPTPPSPPSLPYTDNQFTIHCLVCRQQGMLQYSIKRNSSSTTNLRQHLRQAHNIHPSVTGGEVVAVKKRKLSQSPRYKLNSPMRKDI